MAAIGNFLLFPIKIFIIIVYGAFFRDWGEKMYYGGAFKMPGPTNLHAYIWTFRGTAILMLLLSIFLYIKSLMGS